MLVYTSDGIGIGIGIRRGRSLTIVCKSKNGVVSGIGIRSERSLTIVCELKNSRKRIQKRGGIGIGRIRRFSFSSDSASASVASVSVASIYIRSERSSDSDYASVARATTRTKATKEMIINSPAHLALSWLSSITCGKPLTSKVFICWFGFCSTKRLGALLNPPPPLPGWDATASQGYVSILSGSPDVRWYLFIKTE